MDVSFILLTTEGTNGGSQIEFTLHRVGKGLKGHVLAAMLGIFGRSILRQDLNWTLKSLVEVSPVHDLP